MGTSAGFGYTNTLKGIESIKALLRAQPWQLNNCIYAVEHLKLDLYTHRPNEVIAGRVYNHYITMYPARINFICAMCTIPYMSPEKHIDTTWWGIDRTTLIKLRNSNPSVTGLLHHPLSHNREATLPYNQVLGTERLAISEHCCFGTFVQWQYNMRNVLASRLYIIVLGGRRPPGTRAQPTQLLPGTGWRPAVPVHTTIHYTHNTPRLCVCISHCTHSHTSACQCTMYQCMYWNIIYKSLVLSEV